MHYERASSSWGVEGMENLFRKENWGLRHLDDLVFADQWLCVPKKAVGGSHSFSTNRHLSRHNWSVWTENEEFLLNFSFPLLVGVIGGLLWLKDRVGVELVLVVLFPSLDFMSAYLVSKYQMGSKRRCQDFLCSVLRACNGGTLLVWFLSIVTSM